MKKLFPLLFVVVCSFVLSACGSSSPDNGRSPTENIGLSHSSSTVGGSYARCATSTELCANEINVSLTVVNRGETPVVVRNDKFSLGINGQVGRLDTTNSQCGNETTLGLNERKTCTIYFDLSTEVPQSKIYPVSAGFSDKVSNSRASVQITGAE